MKLEIISPDKLVFAGEVEQVNLPGSAGSFTILPHHAAMISSLKNGNISFLSGGEQTVIKVDGGFAEIKNNMISVCVENVLA